jgi:hypothetical protein
MIKSFLLALVCGFIVFLSSCSKEEGEGGTSTIIGKVYVLDYNSDFSLIRSKYYGPDEDVFIEYGADDTYSDDFKSDYNGTYRFSYLRKGTYTLYAYSKDTTGLEPSGLIPVRKTVEITKNHQTITVDDLIIAK